MARRPRGGLGSIVLLLAGAWVISLFVGGNEHAARNEQSTPASPKIVVDPIVKLDTPQISIREPTTEAEKPAATIEAVRWVRGSKVAFRAGPATSFTILDRFNTGRRVSLLQAAGDWSNVRDALTLREGWVASRFLAEREPSTRRPKNEERNPSIEKREPKPKPVVVPRVEISDVEIADRIIAQSIANYSGNCPCPFNTDRAGRRCGRRSAYSKPGGASPICFVGDVTPAMIAAFRRR